MTTNDTAHSPLPWTRAKLMPHHDTIFDAIGFTNLTQRDQDVSVERISYRIIETMFQIMTLLFVCMACDWQAALGGLVMWYFTCCDRLFYILQKDNNDYGDYYWLGTWSVFYPLQLIGEKRTLKNFNTVSIIGFILGIVIAVL